jgi:3-oxoacyl-[acyl-carrier protein] reductase
MKKQVFITGASRGIGEAIAKQFKAAGYAVIAPPRSELDLASIDSVRAYLKKNKDLEIDILINNAGENKINTINNISVEDWQRTLTTNLTSAFLLIQAFTPSMIKNKWGRIVNISSVYSLLSRPGRAAYSASKSGLNGLTRAAALEYGEHGILVNAACPGFVATEMTRQNNTEAQIIELCAQTAVKRMANPEEIARFIYFLGSENNSFMTGQTLVIDGGFSCQ